MYPIVSGDFNAEPCVEEEMQKTQSLRIQLARMETLFIF
jgi:hypothetical protein